MGDKWKWIYILYCLYISIKCKKKIRFKCKNKIINVLEENIDEGFLIKI